MEQGAFWPPDTFGLGRRDQSCWPCRGVAPVAIAVADALGATLGLVLVRKIGVPMQLELAVGAVADGPFPE